MENARKRAIPDVKRITDPSLYEGPELLVAIECHAPNTKLSKETREYLAMISLETIQWKTRRDFLEKVILLNATDDTPCTLPPNPTDEERATERQRRLNALTTRHRVIFSVWPRDPQTEHFIKSGAENTIIGKTAIKGLQLWGASLFDFYRVQKHPSMTNLETLSTSSKLLEFVKSVGEDYPVARPMVERAEREEDPKMIEPFDISRLIQNEEGEINAYMCFTRKKEVEDKRKEGDGANTHKDKELRGEKETDVDGKVGEEEAHEKDAADQEKGNEAEREEQTPDLQCVTNEDDKDGPKGYSGPYPIESLFSPSCYPEGWMGEPFSGEHTFPWRITDTPPNLQQYLPQRLFPKKLIVHDPYGVLGATRKSRAPKGRWSHLKDITHTYRLGLSTQYTDRRKGEDAEAEKEDANAKRRLEHFLANPHSESERPPGFEKAIEKAAPDGAVAMIYVVLPEVPRSQPAKEAHLYLLPAEDLGEGNHSYVYNAEFEVPRSLLVKEELCMDCVHADVEEQLKERASDLKNARRGKICTKEETEKPQFLSYDGDVYVFDIGGIVTKSEYIGPYDVVVQTRVEYQNLERSPYCQHFAARKEAIHPLTTKVSVAAKISVQHDDHLETEADNYQRFPKHFFEHWSGLNIIRPFHFPVPLGPVVPQFYGYYVPEEAETSDKNKGYLSPILLLEKCGQPIKFEKLSVDDKQECAALLHRLHEADWMHGSVYERNILQQPGPLEAPPIQRLRNTTGRGGYGVQWSYRLIDFGRSEYVANHNPQDKKSEFEFDRRRVARWIRGVKFPFST